LTDESFFPSGHGSYGLPSHITMLQSMTVLQD